jgi:hypothetical protein
MPLATIAVRPGDAARPGALLGTLARSNAHAGLHLGARRHGTRFGYVDPTRFLADSDPPPTLPGIRRNRPPRLGRAPQPALVRRPAPFPRAAAPPAVVARPAAAAPPAVIAGPAAAAPPAVVAGARAAPRPGSSPPHERGLAPWLAWVGLALALAGLGFRCRRPPRTGRVARPVALPREIR